MSGFWDTWRKEIIRGTALFCGVLCVWIVARHLVIRVRQDVTNRLPMALRDLRNEFDPGSDAAPRPPGGTWTYRAKVAPTPWVSTRDTRGPVTAEPAKGEQVDTTALQSFRPCDVARVRPE